MVESAMAGGFKGNMAHELVNQRGARLRLYCPGGRMARELAKNPTVLVVNDTVFAHGGLLPIHVKHGLERLNGDVASWMRGDRLEDGSRTNPPFHAMGCASLASGCQCTADGIEETPAIISTAKISRKLVQPPVLGVAGTRRA